MDTFLGAPETADDWMGTAYADDAEGAVALRRLLHDRGLIPPEHIVFGVDLWLTNDGGGKPKHKHPTSRCSCSIPRVSRTRNQRSLMR
jgi:hypothetical protein